MQILPDLLSISLNTFHNYRRILPESTQDIPYEKVILMEKLFDFQQGTLAYQHPEIESLKSMLIDDWPTPFLKAHGLFRKHPRKKCVVALG